MRGEISTLNSLNCGNDVISEKEERQRENLLTKGKTAFSKTNAATKFLIKISKKTNIWEDKQVLQAKQVVHTQYEKILQINGKLKNNC